MLSVARAIVSGGYDIPADQADIRAVIALAEDAPGSGRPEIQLFAAGSPDALDRTVDVAALSSWLAVRAIDRETTPAGFDRARRGPASDAGIHSTAGRARPAVPSAGRIQARRPVRTGCKPKVKRAASAAIGQSRAAGGQPAGCAAAAPIEIRPAPGAARPAPPRLRPPLVLTPPAQAAPQ